MGLLVGGFLVGLAFCGAIVAGLAMVAWADDLEQGWEQSCYHTGPASDPASAHEQDGPP